MHFKCERGKHKKKRNVEILVIQKRKKKINLYDI